MATREDIIKKVQALLELGKSSNEFEANNANAAAQKLISRHAIEQAEFNSKNSVKPDFAYSSIDTKSKSNILWKERLVSALASVNNCKFITNKNRSCEEGKNSSTSYTVYGPRDKVELIVILFELISNQVEYHSKNFQGKGKSEFNSFKLGMTTRIGQRLKDENDSVIQEHIALKGSESTALVFLNQEKKAVDVYVREILASQGLKLGKAPVRTANLKADAYAAGMKQGDSVRLTNNKALK